VPAAAVVKRNGHDIVFRIEDNRAVEVPVVIGRQIGNLVEVKDGLKDGDKLIGIVNPRIQPGSKISLKKHDPDCIHPRLSKFETSRNPTGASWVCYFRALEASDASKLAPVDKLSVVLVAVLA
jgi:hypothetical protein